MKKMIIAAFIMSLAVFSASADTVETATFGLG